MTGRHPDSPGMFAAQPQGVPEVAQRLLNEHFSKAHTDMVGDDEYRSGYIKGIYDLQAALSGKAQPQCAREPVAWLVTWPDGAKSYYPSEPAHVPGVTYEPLFSGKPGADVWREITDEMIERGARAHCPFAFEAGSGGAGRAEAIEDVRAILTAVFSVTRPENCVTCGLPQSEHHYNGAAYGVCGDYTAHPRPVFKSVTEFTDAELRNELHRRAMLVLGDPREGVSLTSLEGNTQP